MHSILNYHLANFIGVCFFLAIIIKVLLPKINSIIYNVKSSENETQQKIINMQDKIIEYERKLKKIDKDNKKKIIDIQSQTDNFVKNEKENIKKYYTNRKKELDRSLKEIYTNEQININKNTISLIVDNAFEDSKKTTKH